MDEWQSTPSSSSIDSRRKPKRAFVGNLTPNSNLEHKLKDLFMRSNIHIQNLNIIKPKVGNNCFALVECDVDEAVKCLNGVEFQGSRIVVQKEKKRIKKNTGFAGSGTAGGGGFGGGFGGGGWAKPQQTSRPKNTDTNSSTASTQGAKAQNHQNQTKLSATTNDDLMSKLSLKQQHQTSSNNTKKIIKDEIKSFHERCKLNINQLMEEYGDYDPDFEKMKVDLSQPVVSTMTITSTSTSTTKSTTATNNKLQSQQHSTGMLAPNGSAPIDVELVSFGYKYSVPPQARQGWSHSNPLSPIDCRNLPRCPHYVAKLSGLSFKVKKAFLSKDYYLDNNRSSNSDGDNEGDNSSNNSSNNNEKGKHASSENQNKEESTSIQNPLITRSNQISQTILKSIEEAINEGNHGYAFPLQATVYIGSEYGRHRSVVLCENIALNIRKLLRANKDDRISVPVSVCVRHRDVDKQHKDGEAFGDDLRRVHEAEVKRKKKQEWLENRSSDHNYW